MKTKRILWGSLIAAVLVCVGAFAGLTIYMEQQNKETINEAGGICLEQMATQIRLHFSSALSLYSTRLEGIIWRVPPGQQASADQVRDQLQKCADELGFCYVALYDEDGNCEIVSGEDMVIGDEESFLAGVSAGHGEITDGVERSLVAQRDSGSVAEGAESADATHIVLGVSAAYSMESGRNSTVLVVGLPIEIISRALSLDVSETQVYSHIIRSDGSFVLRNSGSDDFSFFDRVRQGTLVSSAAADEVVGHLKSAMAQGEPYSLILERDGSVRNVCVAPLPGTSWYLVSVLPQELIGVPLADLVNRRGLTILVSCGLLVAVILAVFTLYFHLERRQMRLMEQARREADAASQAKSMFLSNMSHDIRTPMNAIMGLASVSLNKIGDDAVIESNLRKIELSSKHLLGLVNNVLDMSLIESGRLTLRPDCVMLSEVIRSVAGIMQPQMADKGISFTVATKEIENLSVMCDSVRLSQALLNLLSNALKFTPESGSVTFEVVGRDVRQGRCLVVFVVRDTGIGMSEEFQQRIFGMFERENTTNAGKAEGSGLGMAITKSIVDAMGGTVSVKSKRGEGSEFTLAIDFECASCVPGDLGDSGDFDNLRDSCDGAVTDAPSSESYVGSVAETAGEAVAETAGERTGEFAAETLEEQARAVVPGVAVDQAAPAFAGANAACGGEDKGKSGSGDSRGKAANGGEGAGETDPKRNLGISGKRILVAEDQELNWEVASALLEPYLPVLEWAKDGQECVELFRASGIGHYDAILMDLQMPRVDGYQATRIIRGLASERFDAATVPIIAMTADVFTGDVARSIDCGMNAHVSKPIDVKVLVGVLNDCIAGS